MRCQKCGGVLHTLVVNTSGNQIFQCHTGLTSISDRDKNPAVYPCGAVHDHLGNIVIEDSIAFRSGNISKGEKMNISYLRVVGGQVQ